MRSTSLVFLVAALAVGCGVPASGGAGQGNGASGSGSSSGGSASGGGSGSSGGSAAICRIATLGYAGEWGQGNVFTDWLQKKSTEGTVALDGQVLTAALLAPYQVIVVQDVRAGAQGQSGVGRGLGRTYSADEVEALRQWVAAGGGLMTLIGYGDSSEITNVNLLLAPFGLSYSSTNSFFGGGSTLPVTNWADHPIAAGVTRVGTNNGYPVLGTAGTLVAWEPNADAPVGRALDSGQGHVFAWADEWITYNSEWTGHPDYQVPQFWANALTWLSRTSGCEVPLPTGEW